MGSGEGRGRSAEDGPGDLLEGSLADMIVRELKVRDEVLALRGDLDEIPREGPEAERLRAFMAERSGELRDLIEERAMYLRALPSPGRLYERVVAGLDQPGCEVEAAHAALIAESAAACMAVIAAQVQLLVDMRSRGLTV